MNKKMNRFKKSIWILVAVVSLLLLSACGDRDEYTIQFETNGGNPIEDIIFNINDPITNLPEPTKEGYAFSGWFLDEEFTETFDSANINDKKVILYAKWVDENTTISITYDTLEDSSSQIVDIKINSKPEPYAPMRDGYVFKGWYLDELYENIYDYEQNLYEHTTLYAKWEEKTDIVLTIIFNQDLRYEFNITDGQMPELDGVVPSYLAENIMMYYYNSTMNSRYDESSEITSSLTIYAKVSYRSYVFYEEIAFDQMDDIINEEYALKDGTIYFKDRKVQHKTSNETAQIWRPVTLIMGSGIQGHIESVKTFADDQIFLFNLKDGTQKIAFYWFLIDESVIEDMESYVDLNNDEKVIQIVPFGDAYVYLTDQQRVIIDGEIIYQTHSKNYNKVDVSDEFQLDEDESFDITNQVNMTMSLTTTKGRVFSLTALLWTYDIFDMTIDDLNQDFMEITYLYRENDPIIYVYMSKDFVNILTEQGHYILKDFNNFELIGSFGEFLDDEKIILVFDDTLLTNLGRLFKINTNQYAYRIDQLLAHDLTIESFKISDDRKIMYMHTSENDIFSQSEGFIRDLTYHFDRLGIEFDDITLHQGFYLEYGNSYYKFDKYEDIQKTTFGFSTYRIDGPYEVGEEVKIETYQDDNYELSGYLYNPSDEKPGYITMTEYDITMKLYGEYNDENSATIKINGEVKGLLRYRSGQTITIEDIEPFLNNTEIIDFIYEENYRVKIELPFETLDQTFPMSINVYTKIKEEAIPIDIHFSSEALYYGKETYYGLEGDLLKDIVDRIDPWPYVVDEIFLDADMTALYDPNQTVEPGLSLYASTKLKESKYLTIYLNDTEVIELPFNFDFEITKYRIISIIDYYYGEYYPVFDIEMFFDELKTEVINDGYIADQSMSIWITYDLLTYIQLYEVDLLGNIVDDYYILWNEKDILTKQNLMDIIYQSHPYDVGNLYHDINLELPVDTDVLDLDQQWIFYYTSEFIEGVQVKVHMYDLSKTYIETIDVYDRYYGVSYYLLLSGYDDVRLFTSDQFDARYYGETYEGLELYGIADASYVNLTLIDTDLGETYELKYPSDEMLNFDAIHAFLINQNPMIKDFNMYSDEELTQMVFEMKINENRTFYIKHVLEEALIPVTFNVSGFYEDSFTVYVYDNQYIDVHGFIYRQLAMRYEDFYQYPVNVYEDAEMTSEISGFVPSEIDEIYIHIAEIQYYNITFIDGETSEILSVSEISSTASLKYVLSEYFYNQMSVPYQFRDVFITEFYEDEALTMPISVDDIDSDKTYYVVNRIPEIITYTYDFSDSGLDDLILEVYETDSLYQDELFNYIYKHYDPMQQLEFYLTPSPVRDVINVEIIVKPIYVVEFIYELDGNKISEHLLFKEGDILEDSLFFGKLFEDPYSYDVYFYTDEAMTDGSLTVVVGGDMTLYLKVVRRY
ncbi:hypothetical protein BK010_09040 [Tenericutes bacterium MO-XQ]|nr:hypothetical protein BK010_09040 [Tenericutes bacterium MO-XQ]